MAEARPAVTTAEADMTAARAGADMTAGLPPAAAVGGAHAIWTMKSRSDPSVRALTLHDADAALFLYNELTVGPPASGTDAFEAVLAHQGTQVLGAFEEETLAAMVTLHVLPNVVWDARPYALIENVVTRGSHQKRGFGRLVMQAAIDAAWAANAYKIMLMTGQKRGATGFYEALGFTSKDKFAMVMRRR